jgi:hypothetical protein
VLSGFYGRLDWLERHLTSTRAHNKIKEFLDGDTIRDLAHNGVQNHQFEYTSHSAPNIEKISVPAYYYDAHCTNVSGNKPVE